MEANDQRGSFIRHDISERFLTTGSQHLTSTAGALVNFLKGCFGTGLLAMPMAFKHVGLAFGAIATIVVGFICANTCNKLVNVSQDICKKYGHVALSYSETAHYVFDYGPQKFKRFGRFICILVDYGLFATYFGIVTVYLVFLANSLEFIILDKLNYHMNVRYYMLILIIPFSFVTQMRSLKFIIPFSAVSNFLIFVTLVIICYYLFNGKLEIQGKALYPRTLSGVPAYFGIVIFAMEAIGLIMPIENKMRHPRKFGGTFGVLNIGMAIITVCYLFIGFLGYVRYGEDVQDVITFNLPKDEIVAQIAEYCILIAIFLTVAVMFHVPIEIILRLNAKRMPAKNYALIETFIRFGLVLIIVTIGMLIPRIELILSLIGCLFFATLGLFFPCVLEVIYLWDYVHAFQLLGNVFIALFAILGLVSGSYVTILRIVESYQ